MPSWQGVLEISTPKDPTSFEGVRFAHKVPWSNGLVTKAHLFEIALTRRSKNHHWSYFHGPNLDCYNTITFFFRDGLDIC
jgi:hypothetical protein